MNGIVFFRTTQRDRLVEFYRDRLGLREWLDQPGGCTILRFGTLLVGFCEATTADTDGTITLVVDDRAAVDDRYATLRDVATGPPRRNEDFDIYQFFLDDPDGRTVEVQTFLHDLPADP
jgi:catechol 2,3-dioxygenase-like lactoylglutathione lyase family enzyme